MLNRHIAATGVIGIVFTLALVLGSTSGCNTALNGFLDPTQVGRFTGPAKTMQLRRSISIADESELEIQSEDPTTEDLIVPKRDYVLQPGDTLDVSVFELMFVGSPWVEMRRVSNEGTIRVPQLRQEIQAGGRTSHELEVEIERALKDEGVQNDPDVTVLIREPKGMMFNVLGAVAAPGPSQIPRPEFRLRDALAVARGLAPAGGPAQPLVRMIYVIRSLDTAPVVAQPAAKAGEIPVNFTTVADGGDGQVKNGHWIYADGEWKFVQTAPETTQPAPVETPAEPVAEPVAAPTTQPWTQVAGDLPQQRIIAIPVDRLQQGDPRYNIVIRDTDTIWVPPTIQGEFYILGNVNRPGVYSITGREITLRQAMSAAGGLGPLADPTRCELTRRLSGDMEQSVVVNLDRILAGKEADIILKADDVVNVGSNAAMPFLAVIRNAFRLTYGFGFVYDRNFADIDSYSSKTNPADYRRNELQQRFGL